MYEIKINYHIAGFSGQMFEIEEVRYEDLPAMVEYWESASAANVKSWEIVE